MKLALALALVCSMLPAAAQFHYEQLKSFGFGDRSISSPQERLLEVSGRLYGTAAQGGSNNFGVVFAIGTDGSGFELLHSFGSSPGDGKQPHSTLIEFAGVLYGTTRMGGISNAGTVFRVGTNGSGYGVLKEFGPVPTDGRFPAQQLLRASDGLLYGMTEAALGYQDGVVFKMGLDGSGYTVLRRFGTNLYDGELPWGGLVEGTNGALYGVTMSGGTNYYGTVFRLNKNGSGYQRLWSFTSVSNAGPDAFIRASDNFFYGASYRRDSGSVHIFRIGHDGSYSDLAYYGYGYEPSGARVSLTEGADGRLYVSTTGGGNAGGGGAIYTLNKDGSNLQTNLSFGVGTEGAGPKGLVQGSDGVLYGMTRSGGTNGAGTTFRVNTNFAQYVTLCSFSKFGGDGAYPNGTLTFSGDGWIYGSTSQGSLGEDTIFRMSTNGSGYQILRRFTYHYPAELIVGTDGWLYGTSQSGVGANGTVFKMNTNGAGFATLALFGGGASGRAPASLVEAPDGFLYGTTTYGGNVVQPSGNGGGTFFRLRKDGLGFAVIPAFNGTNGTGPSGKLILGSDGAFYGCTSYGGSSYTTLGLGTVFRLAPGSSNAVALHIFGSVPFDGTVPYYGLVEATNGFLYGVTSQGGTNNRGTAFRLKKDGSSYEVIRHFPYFGFGSGELRVWGEWLVGATTAFPGGCYALRLDGSDLRTLRTFSAGEGQPFSALLTDSTGALFGVTSGGGAMDYGTVFALRPLAPAFVSSPASQWASPNGTVALNVVVTGTPPLQVQWQLNGANIAGATNTTLTLPALSFANAGRYTVTIQSMSGAVTSAPAFLTVTALERPTNPGAAPALLIGGGMGDDFHVSVQDGFALTNDWQPLATVTLTNNPHRYTDPAGMLPKRFYRVEPAD